jgi:membrane protease YdiL (CAAX protease family)
VFRLLVLVFLGLFGGMLLMGAVNSQAKGSLPADPIFIQHIISFACIHALGLYWITRFLREHHTGWIDGFGLDRAALPSIASGIAAVIIALPVAMILIGSLVLFVLKLLGITPEVQPTITVIKSHTGPWQTAIFGFAAVVLAPLFEESLFRGILYPAFRNRGHRWMGLWFTALLFGVIHWNLAAFIPLTFLAVVFTWMYERTGNLLAPMAAHGVFNAINFWLLVNPPDWEWLQKLSAQ